MKKQRGQAVVEFALVLPFFFLLLFGVILSGMLFADYMTLSNVARSSAREASLQGADKYSTIISEHRSTTHLLTGLYTWPSGQEGMEIRQGKHDGIENSVTVTITMRLNNEFPGVGLLKNKYFNTSFPPETYTIDYTMHNEAVETTTNNTNAGG